MTRAARRERRLDLALVVRLDEGLHAQLERLVDEPGERSARMQDREQEDRVGAGGAQHVELPGIDDELLGQDGHRDGGANLR